MAAEDAVVGEHNQKFVAHPGNLRAVEISSNCGFERDLAKGI